MKRILSTAITFLLIVSVFAILTFDVKATSIKFQMQPLVEGPTDDYATAILKDSSGKIWIFFISFGRIDTGHSHIFYITSIDGGITWTEPSVFLPAYLPGVDAVNGVPTFQDSTGRFWVAWSNYWGVPDEDEIWFTTSSDGVSWADAKVLCRHGNKIGSFLETDGKIWFFFSPRLPNYFHASYITTVDGGNSWSDLVEITSSYDSYPQAIVLSNGTIFVVYNHYPYTIGYCSSSDGGLTWSNTLFNNPEYDSGPSAIEYGGKIYVFFRRLYQMWLPPSDIWFRVWNGTEWEPFQQMTNDPQNFDNGPIPAIINHQIWIVWTRGDPGSQLDIWLAKTISTPSPPRDLIGSPKLSAVELMWNEPSEVIPLSGYRIYRGDSSGAEQLLASVEGDTHKYLDSPVSASLYYYYVTAVNAAGESLPSNEVRCSCEQSFLGIETVVNFESFTTKRSLSNLLGIFTVQQNFEVSVGGSLIHRFWVQNVVEIWPNPVSKSSSLMLGAFEIWESNDGGVTWSRTVTQSQTISRPYRLQNPLILRSTIENDKLVMKNNCKEYNYSLALDSYILGLRSQRQPEIVIVGPPSIPHMPPGTVVFKEPTKGHVDTYTRIGSDTSTWLQGENFLATLPHTGERSKNLKWSTSGDFQYQEGASDQGVFFWPDYDSPIVLPP